MPESPKFNEMKLTEASTANSLAKMNLLEECTPRNMNYVITNDTFGEIYKVLTYRK